jgi:hypothetical protein
MQNLIDISKIIKSLCNYKTINNLSNVQLRDHKKGIQLLDAIYYRFLYTDKNTTKQEIVSKINNMNNICFTRQSYESKETHISIEFYELMYKKIVDYYNTHTQHIIEDIYISVDGTYNNDASNNIMLNMGFFDISNNVPVALNLIGSKNRNNEVKVFIEYLKNNKDKFKDVIFVCDRLYFNYELLYFLKTNNFRYIIRAKGYASNLNPDNYLKKGIAKYDIINELRNNIRIVKCKSSYDKTIYASNSKKNVKELIFKAKNDCILITNLTNKCMYSDRHLLNIYKSRWDIEVYFKLVKSNFKFQNLTEKKTIQYKKLYLCELIITYIMKIIEFSYLKEKKLINKKK